MGEPLPLILGADKSKPNFYLYNRSDNLLDVHFGSELLETVPSNRSSPAYQLLSGRLFNAGVNRQVLQMVFNLDRKTMKRYGDAQKAPDEKEFLRLWEGRKGNEKLGPSERAFLQQQYGELKGKLGCHVTARLKDDLRLYFGCEVTVQAIRNFLRKIEASHTPSAAHPEEEGCLPDGEASFRNGDDLASNPPQELKDASHPEAFGDGLPTLLHHGGLALVRALLDEITKDLPAEGKDLARQWIASVLIGAVNIEQMGQISYQAFELLIGPQKRCLLWQRQLLQQLSTPEMIDALRRSNLQLNMQFCQAPKLGPLLYDPHGIEYTGKQKLTRGWLGSSHKIAKAYYQDFIHTTDGVPLVAFLDDNYQDLRQRLAGNADEFRRLLNCGKEKALVFVIDRAIYDLTTLLALRERMIYIVTWDKGCAKPVWNEELGCQGEFTLTRHRNDSRHVLQARVRYQVEPWSRDRSIHRCTVHLHSSTKEVILPVLCTDPAPDFVEQLHAILTRWLQENSISYTLTNNGMDEMTTYKTVSYAQIADSLPERTMANPEQSKLVLQRLDLRRQLAMTLLKQEDCRKHSAAFCLEREQQLAELQQASPEPEKRDEHKRSIARLKTSIANHHRNTAKRITSLQTEESKHRDELQTIDQQISTQPKEILRLEHMIQEQYRRLNFAPKECMDACRLLANSLFEQLIGILRPILDNYRNDHRLLRELLAAPAVVSFKGRQATFGLMPSRRYAKKELRLLHTFFERISEQFSSRGWQVPPVFHIHSPSPQKKHPGLFSPGN